MQDDSLCPFCQRAQDMKDRTFYTPEGLNWFALLAAPPNMRGHTVLAAKSNGDCPQELSEQVLRGLDVALSDVTQILRAHYSPKHMLISSLRVKDPHVHLHVFPVSDAVEKEWRLRKGPDYMSGRFHEFLGDQEAAAFRALAFERDLKAWTKEEQRMQHAAFLKADAAKLKACWCDIRDARGSVA